MTDVDLEKFFASARGSILDFAPAMEVLDGSTVYVCMHRPGDQDVAGSLVPAGMVGLPCVEGRLRPLTCNETAIWAFLCASVTHMPRIFQGIDVVESQCMCCGSRDAVSNIVQCAVCQQWACPKCLQDAQNSSSCRHGKLNHDLSHRFSFTHTYSPRHCDLCDRDIVPGERAWTSHEDLDVDYDQVLVVDVCVACKAALDAGTVDVDVLEDCIQQGLSTINEVHWPPAVGINEALGVGRMVNWVPVATFMPRDGRFQAYHIGRLGLLLVNTDAACRHKTALVYATNGCEFDGYDASLAFCATELPLEEVVQRIRDADLVPDDSADCEATVDAAAVADTLHVHI